MSVPTIVINAEREVKSYEEARDALLWKLCDDFAIRVCQVIEEYDPKKAKRLTEKIHSAMREVI